MELVGFSPEVTAQLNKLASLSLCPNVVGQIMVRASLFTTLTVPLVNQHQYPHVLRVAQVDLMVKPPVEGDESYDLYVKERDAIFTSLKRRAKRLVESLNALEGVSCCDAEGAMYVFPRVRLSKKAVAAAQEAGKSPDTFYCLRLLDATGLVAVPVRVVGLMCVPMPAVSHRGRAGERVWAGGRHVSLPVHVSASRR